MNRLSRDRRSTPSRSPCCAAASNRWPTRWTRRSIAARSTRSLPRRTTPATASTTPPPATRWCRASRACRCSSAPWPSRCARPRQAAEPRGGMQRRRHLDQQRRLRRRHARQRLQAGAAFFRNGKLYCYMASAAHWHDVGGAVPGNYNPAATECWQEAVQIPPVRIVRGGVLDCRRARHPAGQHAPARQPLGRPERPARRAGARRAAAERPARRVRRRPGAAAPWASCAAARCALMRSHIASLPDGRYSFEDVLDNDGIMQRAAHHRARHDGGRRPAAARLLAHLAAMRGAVQHLARHARWPPATSRSSTCSPMCPPMPACSMRWTSRFPTSS